MKLILLLAAGSIPADAAQPVRAKQAMVVTARAEATDIGLRVLRSGGNAVDAAVAIGFALAVSHPAMCGLGGGFYMLVRTPDGHASLIDAREKASEKASREMYEGGPANAASEGWKAAGVPGAVRGFDLAHRKWGKLRWAELIEPSVRLARDGIPVTHWYEELYRRSATRLSGFADSKRIFLNGGRLWEVGDTLRQPELASTLSAIARIGADEFYTGDTAARFADAVTQHGGNITRADLKGYQAVERTPVRGRYRGHEIISAWPSSSGGMILLQTLGILEGSGFEKHGFGSAASIHWMAEAMRRSFADRIEYLGDPDFVKVPDKSLLDKSYLAARRTSIDPDHATPSDRIRPGDLPNRESFETTHFAVSGADGTIVAVTYTINNGFGSGATTPGLGFLLNNNMDNFAAFPGKPNRDGIAAGEANTIRPGKRPLSSMSPAIVLRDGKPYFVIGTPGGPTIPTAVIQAVVNVIDFGMNARDAIDKPRFHHQWKPDQILLEQGFSPDTIGLLEQRGHKVVVGPSRNDMMAIRFDGVWIEGAADSRHEGKASGY